MLNNSKMIFPSAEGSLRWCLLSAILSGSISIASANPENGIVKAGNADITNISSSQMVIDQKSQKVAIDWESFGIGNGESVNINQPSTSSIILNRVTGSRLSDIQGKLTANGNVFLVNPNGIVLGKNALVDVHGLIATTANIATDDFMADRFIFTGSGNGEVSNSGEINIAENGLVALVAPTVTNTGVIRARLGRVALASGNQFTVDLYGDGLVSLALNDEVSQSLINHSGYIFADGGTVSLTTSAAKSVVDNVINMDGIISARSVTERNGKIVLHAGTQGNVAVSGMIDVSGDANLKGGLVEVLGKDIVLEGKAEILANGATGGGEIYVGGDFQGSGDRMRAETVIARNGSTLAANATSAGDGGTVVLWSDKNTQADGSISAVGGPLGGNGGLVETSSAGQLSFTNRVDVSAPAGNPGTWLIDPEDITIGRGEADSIEATLNDGGSVNIATSSEGEGSGDITVAASITKTEGGDAALALTAHNNVNINAPIISESGELDVKLTAGNSVRVNAQVTTNGGSFSSHINPALAAMIGSDSEDEDGSVTESEDTGDDVEELVAGDTSDVAETDSTVSESVSGQVIVDEIIATNGGEVVIDANTTGSVSVNAQLDTTNDNTGELGGDVFVTGETVALTDSALIDTSGDAGGGRVLIGGGFQGDGEINSSLQTTIASDAQIVTNATTDGDAGQVVVWSDGTTEFNGSITANGGDSSGNGGQIEVSGKQVLRFKGVVDATAANGDNGSLLLDPTTLTIVSNPAQIDNNAALPGVSNSTQEVSVLSWEQIQNLGDIDLLIRTGEDLNFAAMNGGEVVLPQGADMTSARTIAFLSDNGNIVFVEKSDTLRTSGGDIQFGATNGNLDLGVLITENPDSLTGGGTPRNFANYIPGGSITLRASGDITVDRIETKGGSLRVTAGGNFSAGGAGSTAVAMNKAAVNLAVRVISPNYAADGITVTSLEPGGPATISGEMIVNANSISMIGREEFGIASDSNYKAPLVAASDPAVSAGLTLPTAMYMNSGILQDHYTIGAVSTRFNLTANNGIFGVYSFPEYTNNLIESPQANAGIVINNNGGSIELTAAEISARISDLAASIGADRGNSTGISKIFGSELITELDNNFIFYKNPDVTSNHVVSPALGFNGEDLLAGAPPLTSTVTPTPMFVSSGSTASPVVAQSPTVTTATDTVIAAVQLTPPASTSTTQSELIEIEEYAGEDNGDSCEQSNYLAWIGYAVKSAIDVAYMGRGDPAGAVDSVFDSSNCF